jgi:hypothetical protein
MHAEILYFDSPGIENTDNTLAIARQRAEKLGIAQVVVASTHGYTAKRAKEVFADLDVNIIAVSICAGFDDEGWTMTVEERKSLEDIGVTVLTSMHALGDDVNESFGVEAPNKIVRETLYTFCQGMKVAVEVALMAADAGLLNMASEAIAVAGTGGGADTAIVLKPAYTRMFRELRVREILAKPRNG